MTISNNCTLLFFLLFSSTTMSQTIPPRTEAPIKPSPVFGIIPQPNKIEFGKGVFKINKNTKIVLPKGTPSMNKSAKMFTDRFSKVSGLSLDILSNITLRSLPQNCIEFNLKPSANVRLHHLARESYELDISEKKITISAYSDAGFFYGIQSLLQLMPAEAYSLTSIKRKISWNVPTVHIEDIPRYQYRGMHLDVCRHFFPVSFVKKYLDVMAMHKMNTFHWHLTEDQGWRIEIKKYPLLTTKGSVRKSTLIGHAHDKPEKYDSKVHGGFYTQEDIKEIVAYATDRHIVVIPEIEMPGHAQAALAAYPELSCNPTREYEVAQKWGVFEDVFCPSEQTFAFLDDVLTEVAELFPGQYIHIGGDECPKKAWKQSEFCQKLMKYEKLKDENELQSYFIRRIEKILNQKGKKLIGWDEILEGGLAPNATVMSWRGTEGGIAAAKQNHDVIMTPNPFCYFDHYQAEAKTEPLAIGGFTDLEKVYNFEPTPSTLSSEEAAHILGAQGNVWTEYMSTPEQVEYMAFPRAIALSEVLWSQTDNKNYADFVIRMKSHQKRLDYMKINSCKKSIK
jgi:hexosaminidase